MLFKKKICNEMTPSISENRFTEDLRVHILVKNLLLTSVTSEMVPIPWNGIYSPNRRTPLNSSLKGLLWTNYYIAPTSCRYSLLSYLTFVKLTGSDERYDMLLRRWHENTKLITAIKPCYRRGLMTDDKLLFLFKPDFQLYIIQHNRRKSGSCHKYECDHNGL